MRVIRKLFSIFTREERKYCAVLLICMLLGGIFEAVGISAILPLISILSDPQFLEKHEIVYKFVARFGITQHGSFLFSLTGILIFWYIGKNLYMIWLTKRQVAFIVEKQIVFSKRLMTYYLRKSYLAHLEQNSAALLRNLHVSVSDIFRVM